MVQSKNWKHPPGNSIDRWLRWHLRPNFSREARRDPLPAGRHRLLCQLSPRDRRAFGEPSQIWRLVQGDQLSNISSKLEAKGFKPKWFNHAFPKGIHHIKILIYGGSLQSCVLGSRNLNMNSLSCSGNQPTSNADQFYNQTWRCCSYNLSWSYFSMLLCVFVVFVIIPSWCSSPVKTFCQNNLVKKQPTSPSQEYIEYITITRLFILFIIHCYIFFLSNFAFIRIFTDKENYRIGKIFPCTERI